MTLCIRVSALLICGALALGSGSPSHARNGEPPFARQSQQAERSQTQLSEAGVSTFTDLRIFTAGVALRLAGIPRGAAPDAGGALETTLLSEIKVRDEGAVPALKEYLSSRLSRGSDRSSLVAALLSLSVIVNEPPAFQTVTPPALLPADLREFLDVLPLLSRLFSGSNIRAVYNAHLKEIEGAALKVFAAAPPMIAERTAYLHTKPVTLIEGQARTIAEDEKHRAVFVRNRPRRMVLYFDPMAPPETVVVRNDVSPDFGQDLPDQRGDDYVLIIGPTSAREVREIGRAYTRYLLDPVLERASPELVDPKTHKPTGLGNNILQLAAKAQTPSDELKDSAALIVRESLVYAIEAGIARVSNSDPVLAQSIDLQNRAMLAREFGGGAVLGFHFYAALKGLESSGVDFRGLVVPFLRSIKFDIESKRPDEFAEIRAAYEASRPKEIAASPPSLPGANASLTADLLTADRLISEKDYTSAEPLLRRLITAYPNNARLLYGLAQVINNSPSPEEADPKTSEDDLVAVQEKRLGQAIQVYLKAIETASAGETWIKSRCEVAIAKIYEFKDLNDDALEHYENAIKLGDVPNGAYQEAVAARTRLKQ